MQFSPLIPTIITSGGAIIGLTSLFFFLAQRRYPGRLTFARDPSIALVHKIARNLPDLAISYKEKPISERLILLKGYLINTGAKDINKQMIDHPLTMMLPEGYRWLEVKVIDSSPNVNAAIRVLPDAIAAQFHFPLLRRNEYICLEALAEIPYVENDKASQKGKQLLPRLKLEEALSFTHHISDTRKVDQFDLAIARYRYKTRRRILLFPAFVLSLALVFATASLIYITVKFREIQYQFPIESSKTILVRALPKPDGSIELKGINESYSEMLSLEEFARADPIPEIGHVEILSLIPLLAFVSMLMMALWTILLLMIPGKSRKIKRILPAEDIALDTHGRFW